LSETPHDSQQVRETGDLPSGSSPEDEVVAAIELGDFQADRQDQSWQQFLTRAAVYGAQLEAEGRDV
jgi:hypothetical protein